MKLFTLSILLGIGIPLATLAQEKKTPAAKPPAKPETSNPPIAVAKPVAEPVAEPESPPEPAKPEPDPQAPGESGPPPPVPTPPEPAPVDMPPEEPQASEPADPPGTRVTLVDGTRRIALPLQKTGEAPVAGKQTLPTVTSPYPPKALAPLPAGWTLQIDPTVAPLPHQVKLADGRTLELEVIPPCLVPESLGKMNVFQIERGSNSPESTLSAARKAHAESRAKVQELLRKLETTIPPPPAPPSP